MGSPAFNKDQQRIAGILSAIVKWNTWSGATWATHPWTCRLNPFAFEHPVSIMLLGCVNILLSVIFRHPPPVPPSSQSVPFTCHASLSQRPNDFHQGPNFAYTYFPFFFLKLWVCFSTFCQNWFFTALTAWCDRFGVPRGYTGLHMLPCAPIHSGKLKKRGNIISKYI